MIPVFQQAETVYAIDRAITVIGFRMYAITQQTCAGNKQKSYKITRMNMFTAQDMARTDVKNTKT
jgi:hypothetical protein